MFDCSPRRLFPRIERFAHAGTLFRRLCRIDIGQPQYKGCGDAKADSEPEGHRAADQGRRRRAREGGTGRHQHCDHGRLRATETAWQERGSTDEHAGGIDAAAARASALTPSNQAAGRSPRPLPPKPQGRWQFPATDAMQTARRGHGRASGVHPVSGAANARRTAKAPASGRQRGDARPPLTQRQHKRQGPAPARGSQQSRSRRIRSAMQLRQGPESFPRPVPPSQVTMAPRRHADRRSEPLRRPFPESP